MSRGIGGNHRDPVEREEIDLETRLLALPSDNYFTGTSAAEMRIEKEMN
jgi:hypothetical protein